MKDKKTVSQDEKRLKLYQKLEELSLKIDRSEERAEKLHPEVEEEAEKFQIDLKKSSVKFVVTNILIGLLALSTIGVFCLVLIDTEPKEIVVRFVY